MTHSWWEQLESIEGPYVVITDSNVHPLIKNRLTAKIHSFPAGEASKTRTTKEAIEDQMQRDGHGREITIVAIGGGVVTDLAGFIAATYCRGVPLIMVPTTLLAMVDAAIGGKNGVNTPHGKNLIGTFYPPKEVILDLSFLQTLPEREFQNGMMEVIKYACIADSELFAQLEKETPAPESIVQRCITIKKEIVASDPQEQGRRRILNFGHTIGHALELATQYQLSHGEAIALGMIKEAQIATQMNLCSFLDALTHLIHTNSPQLTWPSSITPKSLWPFLQNDKKSLAGIPRMVAIESPGKPHPFDGSYCIPLPANLMSDKRC